MDVEDEANSYLKYLNDSDTPNTYLLGNNEVGLFSVEPIFTEMEATDWPQEGFPLLLNNSLITEDVTVDQNITSQNLGENTINGTLPLGDKSDGKDKNVQEASSTNCIENRNIEVQNFIEIHETNDVPFDETTLQLDTNNSHHIKEDILLTESNMQPMQESDVELQRECGVSLDKNCLPLEPCIDINSSEIQTPENELPNNKNNLEFNEDIILQKNNIFSQLKPNEKYILVKGSPGSSRIIKVKNNEKSLLKNSNSLLKSSNLSFSQTRFLRNQKKSKNINDLFSTVLANKCKICGFLCENLEQIKKHIHEEHPTCLLTHNGLSSGVSVLLPNVKKETAVNNQVNNEFTVYLCSECHEVYRNKNDLKLHMTQMHSLKTDNAVTSNTETVEKAKLKENNPNVVKKTSALSDVNISQVKKQEKSLQKVRCKVSGCAASFPTEELCDSHEILHIRNKKSFFKCKECEQTFMMWRVARNHMYKEHEIDFGMIVCPICNVFKSYKAARILKHMLIHSETEPFQCRECGKSFKQMAQLKNHEVVHKTPEDLPSWCRVRKCDRCHAYLANSKSLKSHIQAVHENIKPFICTICGHKTTRKSLLMLHVRHHMGDKPHKCDHCQYRTGDHNALRKHVMTHLGEAQYQCSYCPYRCIQSGALKNHLLKKHKGRGGTFSCKYCPYSTINASFLDTHERKHVVFTLEGAESESTYTEKRNETDLLTNEERQGCYLNTESQIEETVDNGGITVTAGLDMQLAS